MFPLDRKLPELPLFDPESTLEIPSRRIDELTEHLKFSMNIQNYRRFSEFTELLEAKLANVLQGDYVPRKHVFLEAPTGEPFPFQKEVLEVMREIRNGNPIPDFIRSPRKIRER